MFCTMIYRTGWVAACDERSIHLLGQVLHPLRVASPYWPRGVQAGGAIETSGDILQFVLPGAAAALTLGNWDKTGALEFGESAAATLGTTYLLKYTVDEKRPNGGSQSFPSAHTSISFCAAEYMRKRYGLGTAFRLMRWRLLSLIAAWKQASIIRTMSSRALRLASSAATSSPNHTKAGRWN